MTSQDLKEISYILCAEEIKMTDKELKEWKHFFDTEQAVITTLLNLIQDLVPVIGLDEAQRLLNIIKEATREETQESIKESRPIMNLTREEVIKELEVLKHDSTTELTENVLDYAITALKTQPDYKSLQMELCIIKGDMKYICNKLDKLTGDNK